MQSNNRKIKQKKQIISTSFNDIIKLACSIGARKSHDLVDQ